MVAISIYLEYFTDIAIKVVEAIIGGNPDQTLRILAYSIHIDLRKSLFFRNGAEEIGRRLAEQEGCKANETDDAKQKPHC